MGEKRSFLVAALVLVAACGGNAMAPPEGGGTDGGSGGGGAPAACTPTTCAAAGKDCGSIPDGCGGTLECGSCSVGQACGGGAAANVCGTSPLAPGATRWVQILSTPDDDVMWGVGSDRDGNALALWYATSDQALRLDHGSEAGLAPFERYPILPSADMTDLDQASLLVGGDGSLYVHAATSGSGYIDLGGGAALPHPTNQVARLQADGTFVQDINGCTIGCNTQILAASATGDVVLLSSGTGVSIDLVRGSGAQMNLYSWDGTNVSGPLASTGCWAAAFAPDGNLVCGGFSTGGAPVLPTNPGNTGFSASPAIVKLDLEERILWAQVLPLVGSVSGVGASAAGTVFAAGLFSGSGQFANDRLDHPSTADGDYAGFLVTLDADGAPRWGRQLDHAGLSLAVDPVGDAAVITAASRFGPVLGPVGPSNTGVTNVVYYDDAGALHWSKSLPPRFAGVAIRDRDVLVGGTWSGSFDFGSGAMTSEGDDGYLLDLAP